MPLAIPRPLPLLISRHLLTTDVMLPSRFVPLDEGTLSVACDQTPFMLLPACGSSYANDIGPLKAFAFVLLMVAIMRPSLIRASYLGSFHAF